MNSYIFAAVVLYTAWAIYSGYKYVNGRYQWLEQPEIAHRICKYVAIWVWAILLVRARL